MDELYAQRLAESPPNGDIARRAGADEAQGEDLVGSIKLRVYDIAQRMAVDGNQIVPWAQANLVGQAARVNGLY
jgi:hypothetical protein